MTRFNIHLVSDATGETLQMVAKAAITQFEGYEAVERLWTMVRTPGQLQVVIDGIQEDPGVVMFTMVNRQLQRDLVNACRSMELPCVDVLNPAITSLRDFLNTESKNQPGRQHALDDDYFERIDAMQFCLSHDDGQSLHDLDQADVVLVGVSRTSKTPTCMYLANRGIKAANVPLVPEREVPDEVLAVTGPLIVGLTNSVSRLAQVRRSRLLVLKEERDTSYVDEEAIKNEVAEARRLFSRMNWPVIDTTGRSIEETAAVILKHLATHKASA
ncbi:MAG: kinase/pyrophosphorylase [Alphaproteobacteria bacterium]|nr:kinase/pyrophosphorylase [Alphaproteobacteria bacterium]